MTNTPTLTTQRLILRKFTLEDLEAIFTIFKDKEANTFLPWFPLKDMEEAKSFYKERYEKGYQQDQGYYYAICLKENNVPIGYVNINTDESYDLGYGLMKEYWHLGYTSEAVAAVISQAQHDGIPYITATHDINNPRSGNLMKNVGMKYCYSYEEPWQPKNMTVIFRMYQLNLNTDPTFVYKGYWKRFPNHFIETDI